MKKTLLFAVLAIGCAGYANVKVPAIFSDHAILQTSPATAVFGKADPGEKVAVSYGSAKAETVAGKDGKWLVKLDLSKDDGKGKDLIITGKNKIVAKDVITGEVWFCIGQSNMAMSLIATLDAKAKVAKSANDRIRHFRIPVVSCEKPRDNIQGKWVIASPQTTNFFSATGYFFARKVNAETGKAVGLVNPSWGGSCIESWISREKLMQSSTPRVAQYAKVELDHYFNYDAKLAKYVKAVNAWAAANKRTDDGKSVTPPADAKWVKVPRLNTTFAGNGIVWFRKTIEIKKRDIAGKKVFFEFGCPAIPVKLFIDGKFVYEVDLANAAARQYPNTLAAEIATPGKHEVLLRVSALRPNFNFPGTHRVGHERNTFGGWEMCREYDFPKLDKKQLAAMPKYLGPRPHGRHTPAMIWNGLVHPLIPYTMKGALWYQGENNAGGSKRILYGDQIKALISDLREHFNNPDMRFYAVQLPGFMAKSNNPNAVGNWPVIREGQSSAMNIPGVAQAITIDLGEANDIHPIEKEPVGERLALIALANDYGKKIPCYSPVAVEAVRNGSAVTVSFKYTDGGLTARELPEYYWLIRNRNQKAKLVRNSPASQLEGFAVCGKDGKWVWADAKISGNKVIVSAPAVKEPTAVRYAWQNNPTCNLYNGAGLPAAPFQLKVK